MAERTIFLKKRPIRKEGIADGAIIPGHLVKLASDGKFDVHGTAKGYAVPAFAMENELNINGDTDNDIDTPYAQNDRLLYGVCSSGAEVYALVAAAASAIVAGDFLESAGDGTLRKITAQSQSGTTPFAVTEGGKPIAMALEAVDNSGGGAVARIIVEIL